MICLQYLLKTNKISESEKAQQDIAAERLPNENMAVVMQSLLLIIKLELPLKIGIQLPPPPPF